MAKKEIKIMHWADQTAEQIISRKKDKKEYVVATGVTPSGTLHIGNFRELITGSFIAKALTDKKKKAVHYHYWDDYDVFRKVPANMPKADILKKFLRQALIYVPDVVDNKHKNYPEHNEKEVEVLLPMVGLTPTILKNSEILDQHRKEPLEESWLPISVYCEKCNLEAEKIKYDGDYNVSYECSCGDEQTFDIRKKGLAKLKWRVQWPAWWHQKDVDFESAGKDHFAAGGSRTTGQEIQTKVYGTNPPMGFGFGWIGVKGGKQFSSSAGVIFTLKDVLDIYEPSIVRYIFAGSRPTSEFAISFDLDVLKIYEDFDKCERIYFDKEEASDKEKIKQKRIYELSSVKIPKKMPYQPSFRHLTSLLQIHEKDIKKTMDEFKDVKTKEDKDKLKLRMQCVLNWLENYAPDEFKFTVQKEAPKDLKLDEKEKEALKSVAKLLDNPIKDKELHENFYNICKDLDLNVGDFFKAAYKLLINKERGPRLASFILTIGKKKVKELFSGF